VTSESHEASLLELTSRHATQGKSTNPHQKHPQMTRNLVSWHKTRLRLTNYSHITRPLCRIHTQTI
jgi:hypothetical protein